MPFPFRRKSRTGLVVTCAVLSLAACQPLSPEVQPGSGTGTHDSADAGRAERPEGTPAGQSPANGAGAPDEQPAADGAVEAEVTEGFETKVTEGPESTQRPGELATVLPGSVSAGIPLVGSLSNLGWRSGTRLDGSNPEKSAAFAEWRGSALDVVLDFGAREDWDDIVNPTWFYDTWAGAPYLKVFSVGMIPEGVPGATIGGCARGEYAEKWREFGANIQAAGFADETIIRLGWEFNGDWFVWSDDDPEAWAQCWRSVVTNAESRAPELRWDWTVNRGPSLSQSDDPRDAYPGDEYVDVVGIDSYDIWPGVRSEADWQQHLNGEYGLQFWADFAAQHGKQLSVPEWGLYPGIDHRGNNGGDNPLFIEKMTGFFRSLGEKLAYEAYFNEPDAYSGSSLWNPGMNPEAAAAYRQIYSAG